MQMRKTLSILALGLSFIPITDLSAQPAIVAKFAARSHTFGATTLPYRLFVPDNYDPGKKYPVVLALHGSGERGDDNLTQIQSYRLATSWADPANQATYPCFVVAPQCPLGGNWSGETLSTANDILDSLMNEFNIDVNRLYVTGLSMGGFGTWELIMRHPDRFAAAVPMSAGADTSLVATITEVPIWNFHGTLDESVPVQWSRDTIAEIEANGQRAVYTNCITVNCKGIPDSIVALQVASHANLLYTEYETGTHVIWDESYDHPQLFPWVFSKYRRIPDAIALSGFEGHPALSGIETINWNGINPQDSVEIWFSPNAGESWQLVSRSETNSNAYEWDTQNVVDCAFGRVQVFLKNGEGFIYGRDQSGLFRIDNGQNGIPFVRILNNEFNQGVVLDQSDFDLRFLIGDAESAPVDVSIEFSSDNAQTFTTIANYQAETDTVGQTKSIDLASLPNTNQAVFRVEVNDGITSSTDQTYHFVKSTSRSAGIDADHISGSAGGTVNVYIVDPNSLTGDLYRVTFDDTTYSDIAYDVINVSTDQTIIDDAVHRLDGATEGALFDGLRLSIKNFAAAQVDHENTQWTSGTATLDISATLPTIDLGNEILDGFPHPADYRISFFDQVVDTSSTEYGAAATSMKFRVYNLTEDKDVDIIFIDSDNDQNISLFDEIFILEPDSSDNLRLTWSIAFSGTQQDTPPAPGDEMIFRTVKPLTSRDVYEFRIATTSVAAQSTILPQVMMLYQNYPNPFNPATTISYFLPHAEWVQVSVFNMLGQKVVSLVEERQSSGMHTLIWDGKNGMGNSVGNGVYFMSIVTRNQSLVRKMILMR